MKGNFGRKSTWGKRLTSVLLVISLIVTLFPTLGVYTSEAAAARITIEGLYTETNDQGMPVNLDQVPRFTSSSITVNATIENISDSQIANIYYEVTNITTGITTSNTSNVAQKTGTYDIAFTNVNLTEGLNRIVLKYGTTDVIASAPAWAYFTPTIDIQDLMIDGNPFVTNKIYPENPSFQTALSITGRADNANEVLVYRLGSANPINAYFNNGEFILIADDINNPNAVANMLLTPGDNYLTFVAQSASRMYQTERNLIYDNGGPFVFDARIAESGTVGQSELLVTNPTVTKPTVNISAQLKVDVNSLNELEYSYVDVTIGGQNYGTYHLGGATPATRVNSLSPTTVYEGHGPLYFTITGTSLDNNVTVNLRSKDGTLNENLNKVNDYSSSNVQIYSLMDSSNNLINLESDSNKQPYILTIKHGSRTVHTQQIQVLAKPADFQDPGTLKFNIGDIRQQQSLTGEIEVEHSNNLSAILRARIEPISGTGSQIIGNLSAPVGNVHTVNFTGNPTLTKGDYRLQLIDGNNRVYAEELFSVGSAPPADPAVDGILPTNINAELSFDAPANFVVYGENLSGEIIEDADSPKLVKNADGTKEDLKARIVKDSYIVFELEDPANLEEDEEYYIEFKLRRFDEDGGQKDFVVSTAADYLIEPTNDTNYDTIVNPPEISKNSVVDSAGDVLQFLYSPTASQTVKILGENLDDSTIYAEIYSLDNITSGSTGVTLESDATLKEATFEIPNNLGPGDYLVQIVFQNGGNTEAIAAFPITVVEPVAQSYAIDGNMITIHGRNLGNKADHLKLKIKSVTGDAVYTLNPVPNSFTGESIQFPLPSMEQGSYEIYFVYDDDVEVTTRTLSYTVTSSPNQLAENANYSKSGQYRVFTFEVKDLTISTEKYQLVEFTFHNMTGGDTPTSTFWFNYVDPNLPYVEYVTRGPTGIRLNETGENEISELPLELTIYTNDKTDGIEVYLGEYDLNSTPYITSNSRVDEVVNGENRYYFKVVLPDIPNGPIDLTVLPIAGSVLHENGGRTYSLRVSSTPDVIVNNLYNGLVIRNGAELVCTDNEVRCLDGRLINVPLKSDGTIDDSLIDGLKRAEVKVYHNELERTLTMLSGGRFKVNLASNGPDPDANFNEGKNTIRFEIYIRGVKVSETTFEFFYFSTDAPEFVQIVPIDNENDPDYLPGSLPSSYVTTESSIAFRGSFVNATSIQLTIRTTDEDGNPQTSFDRRFGTGFNSKEPINANYFDSVSNGKFETRALPLAPTGETVFEFTITNKSNIHVTRTITVLREPQPYKIISPVLVKNAKGEDQANINKNFVLVEIEAEGADQVIINKQVAAKEEIVNELGLESAIFRHEILDIRPGRSQKVDFTVIRGEESIRGSFQVFNAGTPIEGAQVKSKLSNRMNIFDGQIQLQFPRNTYLMRNSEESVNQYITQDRRILFGIANKKDGRVDKYVHPAATDGQLNNPNPIVSLDGELLLKPPARYRAASNLFWIDAGTISEYGNEENAYTGSGRLPYANQRFYARNEQDLVVPTNPGTITLKFDPIIRNEGWRYVTVFHFDLYEDHTGPPKRWRWRNLGGVVDTKNNTITVPFERFGYYQVMYMDQSYDDIIAHEWARHDLDTLVSKGYMVPKAPPNQFIPNDPITRGEFATLLVKIFDIPLQYTETPTFSDVLRVNPLTNGIYDYKYIETAARAGIVRGAGGGLFYPNRAITREEAAVMIARAANMRLNNDPDKSLANLQKSFTDANLIDVYARPAVEAVSRAGLITGKPNVLLEGQSKPTYRYDPKSSMLRSEAASIAMRVLAQQKKTPR